MMESGRNAYQKELDQVHLSDEKAEETLRLMMAENDAVREKERKRASRRFPPIRIWLPALGAVAACLILVLTGVFRTPETYSFAGISVRKLPVSGIRGDENPAEKVDLTDAEALFPGWTVSGARPERKLRGLSPDGSELDAALEKNGVILDAIIMYGRPQLAEALEETEAYGTYGVRFNHDPDTGVLCAVYARDGYYVILSAAGMEEKNFSKAVMEAAGK